MVQVHDVLHQRPRWPQQHTAESVTTLMPFLLQKEELERESERNREELGDLQERRGSVNNVEWDHVVCGGVK